MSKDKKDQQKQAPVKKGSVIDRRNNRTVNFDVARSDPKWRNVIDASKNPPTVTGKLQNIKHPGTFIERDRTTGSWQSVAA